MKRLIEGAYDLHVHSAPDILPRKMDDIEMANRIVDSGMAGYAIKSHYFVTAERATLMNKLFPNCHTIGTITLNSSVGGINPTAVEMAARAGAKLVWFPTTDSVHEQAHVFSGNPNQKMPYWAKIMLDMKSDGIKIPTISLLNEDQTLKKEVLDVLSVIAKHDIILATGHCSHEETFALVKEAHSRGVKKIIITHVDFPSTFYSVEQQKELVSYGAYMEHCYTTFATGKVDFKVTVEQIKAIGPDHVVLGTDLGQPTALYPDEGLLEFATLLYNEGFTEEEIRKMTVDNNRFLLGL
ncbi:DUF6282 family protein [Fusibacter bizertensis]